MLCNYFRNRLLYGVKDLPFRVKSIFSCYCPNPNVASTLKQYSQAKSLRESIERTITVEDVELFSKITGDYNVVHLHTNSRPAVVHGALLNGLVSGVIGTKLPGNGTIVISQTLNFPKSCYVGDTVVISVEIEDLRKIMTCKYQVVNKFTKDVLMEGSAKLLFKKPIKNDSD